MSDKQFSKKEALAPPVMGPRFKGKKILTRDLISAAHFDTITIKAQGEMYKRTLPITGKGNAEIDTDLLDCLDVDKGVECTLILNAIIKSAFERAIPPLLGRYFELVTGQIREGKRYRSVSVYELQLEDSPTL